MRLQSGDLRPVECGAVRAACHCAHCVDDMTGEVKIDRERILADRTLHAISLRLVGKLDERNMECIEIGICNGSFVNEIG